MSHTKIALMAVWLSLGATPVLASAGSAPALVRTFPQGGLIAPTSRESAAAEMKLANEVCAPLNREAKIVIADEARHTMTFHCFRKVTRTNLGHGDTGY